jgi:hypothetical protein
MELGVVEGLEILELDERGGGKESCLFRIGVDYEGFSATVTCYGLC